MQTSARSKKSGFYFHEKFQHNNILSGEHFCLGSARVPRAGLGVAPKPSEKLRGRKKLFGRVFGGTPKTARQRRALPELKNKMNLFNTIFGFAAAFLAVFGETIFSAPRHLFGAQIDLLPALMIYAALNTNVVSVSILAIAGGLWFDALSANPLGVTILPLFAI